MRSLTRIVALVACSLAFALTFADSGGDKAVNSINALKRPTFDRTKQNDPGYRQEYMKELAAYSEKRNGLILNLYKAAPNDPRTADLMEQRWLQFRTGDARDPSVTQKAVMADIAKIMADNPPEAIRERGAYCKSMLNIQYSNGGDPTAAIDEFVKAFPKSEKAPELMFMGSFQVPADKRTQLYRRMVDGYPNYKNISMVRGALRQADGVNQPFDLKFTDAIGGQPVDLASFKGKVVLIDFWATWCGPCVAEMPEVKDFYAKYHSKGLEMVGVSLDEPEAQGGLTKLKDFVAKNQMPWPQYYQGDGWNSKFSSGWGIMSIPTMFVVDKDGKLVGPFDARDPKFEPKIQKLLGS